MSCLRMLVEGSGQLSFPVARTGSATDLEPPLCSAYKLNFGHILIIQGSNIQQSLTARVRCSYPLKGGKKMNPSLLEPPRPAGEPSVSSAIRIPVSEHLAYFLESLQGCLLPLGWTPSFCGVADKSLPLSVRVSSSIKHRAYPPPLDPTVVPALRVGTGRGQSQATMFCCGFFSCCQGWGGCLPSVPLLQWLCSLSKAPPRAPRGCGSELLHLLICFGPQLKEVLLGLPGLSEVRALFSLWSLISKMATL